MLNPLVIAQNIMLLLKNSLVTAQVLQLILGFFYRSFNYSYCSNNNIPFTMCVYCMCLGFPSNYVGLSQPK